MQKKHCTTYYQLKYSKKKNVINQGGTRCFARDTLVKTDTGYKNIQDIKPSDNVLSYNEKENKFEYKMVKELHTFEVGTNLTKPLIEIKINGEVIICTYDHEIYTITEDGKQKGWIPAFIFAKRGMATSEWDKLKILCQQLGEDLDDQLQMHWTSKDNATSLRWVRVLQDNDKTGGWGVPYCQNPQGNCKNIPTKRKSSGQSYKWGEDGQPSIKPRMGYRSRKHITCGEDRVAETEERGIKWDVQTHRTTSKGNKSKVQTKDLHGENFSSGIQGITSDNQRYYLSQKDLEARIVDNQTVYDLTVQDNHNYVITKSDLLVHNSGKTYSTLEFLIELLLKYPNKGYIVEIVRHTRIAAMSTVARDFEEILKNLGVFHRPNWRKLEGSYTFDTKDNRYNTPNIVYFSGMDGESARGRKRHILYVNEANQIDGADFLQLQLRTMNKIIIDFNPSFITHGWIDELLEARDAKGNKETDHFITTYKDNPFLTSPIIKSIEDLKESNPTAWIIFGTGHRSKREDAVFTNYEVCEELKFDAPIYGLDFGYNDPCSLIKVELFEKEKTIHAQQILYKSKLSIDDLITHISRFLPSGGLIIADSSSPGLIEHLNNKLNHQSIRVIAASKVTNVVDQLALINQFKTCIVGQDLEREFKMYSFMVDKDDNPIDKIDAKRSVDHAIDAFRYASYYQLSSLAKNYDGLASMLNLLKKQKQSKINNNR
jgi:phage terminase large subunit